MALARCNFSVQDEDGNIVDGASIEVREEVAGLPLRSPYSDRAGTIALGNPFVAADGADAGFFIAGGAYQITATLGAFTRTWNYVPVGLMQESDIGGGGGGNRTLLTVDTNFYVRSDGSNANNGQANTAGGAWLTLQYAYDYLANNYDFQGLTPTINIGTGTFAGFHAQIPTVGQEQAVGLVFLGNGRANTTITETVGEGAVWSENGIGFTVRSLKVTNSASGGNGILCERGGEILYDDIDFGVCDSHQLESGNNSGVRPSATSTCFITGGGAAFAHARSKSVTRIPSSLTISNSVTYTVGFVEVYQDGLVRADTTTFTNPGNVTGPKYNVRGASDYQVGANTLSDLPGSTAGVCIQGSIVSSTLGVLDGGNIEFPASQNASADANTLDDYEEGTFTPVFTAATTPPTGVTYSTQNGRYTKIGRMVYVDIDIVLTSKGAGGVGSIRITGLPFTVAAGLNVPAPLFYNAVDNAAGYSMMGAAFQASTTEVSIREMGDNIAAAQVTWAAAADTSQLKISGYYPV